MCFVYEYTFYMILVPLEGDLVGIVNESVLSQSTQNTTISLCFTGDNLKSRSPIAMRLNFGNLRRIRAMIEDTKPSNFH